MQNRNDHDQDKKDQDKKDLPDSTNPQDLTASDLEAQKLFGSAIEVPTTNTRYDNIDPKRQIQRDFNMVSRAIEKPGDDQNAALILKNIYTLLAFGDLYYKRNKQWHLWSENPQQMPIVSALGHGARIVVQFPAELREEILQWLFVEKANDYKRFAATHAVDWAKESEQIGETKKVLSEIKRGLPGAAYDATLTYLQQYDLPKDYLPKDYLQHYGVNLALGGAGNVNPISQNKIVDDGGHGHLYISHNYPPASENVVPKEALLIGIEQSAPGSKGDQYGGTHTIFGTHLEYTATGGDDFAKSPEHIDKNMYVGLKDYGPDEYYDSLFLDLTPEKFAAIKQYSQEFSTAWLMQPGQKIEKNKNENQNQHQHENIQPPAPKEASMIDRINNSILKIDSTQRLLKKVDKHISEIEKNSKQRKEEEEKLRQENELLKKQIEEKKQEELEAQRKIEETRRRTEEAQRKIEETRRKIEEEFERDYFFKPYDKEAGMNIFSIEQQLLTRLYREQNRLSIKNKESYGPRLEAVDKLINLIKGERIEAKNKFMEFPAPRSKDQIDGLKLAYKKNIQDHVIKTLNNESLKSHRHWAKKLARVLLNAVMVFTLAPALLRMGLWRKRATLRVTQTQTKDVVEKLNKRIKRFKV